LSPPAPETERSQQHNEGLSGYEAFMYYRQERLAATYYQVCVLSFFTDTFIIISCKD
jgi:hypothetical protein